MPKSTKYVTAKKLVHSNSRKAFKLGANAIHKEKVKKVHYETTLKQSVLQEKLLWMQDHMDKDKPSYTEKDMCELAEKYLKRFDEELEQINIIHGVGSRKKVPDLCDGRNLKVFKAWEGEVQYLQNIKLIRVKQSMNIQESSAGRDEDEERLGEDGDVVVEFENEAGLEEADENDEEEDGKQGVREQGGEGAMDGEMKMKENT